MASNTHRRDFLKMMGAGAASLTIPGMSSASNSSSRRPNVIVFITDDQGYGDLECTGNPHLKTPNWNRLYRESARLQNFHVSPTCSPTRAALMTGRYNIRTGVWHTIMGRSLLRRDEVTMADVFAASGYQTGIFGKWHLGDNYPFRPQDRGFQEVFVHGGGGVGQTPDYWGNDYFDDTYFRNGEPVRLRGYCTDIWFDNAIRFIEANQDNPFFAYVTTNAAHGPFNVADEYSKPYREKGLPESVANFYGMIENLDDNLGRLLQRLHELELEEDTILIFLGDNGSARPYYDGGLRGSKGSPYEGGHRVACLVRWPGHFRKGSDVNHLTAHIDLLPTLIDVCDLARPEGVEFDGTSIAPLLTGEASGWRDRTLVIDSQRIEKPQKWRKSAVMTDRWRLINGKELYDVTADRKQKNDVSDQNPEVVAKLRDAYERWWQSVSTRFDEYCRIVLGASRGEVSALTCHDWHGGGMTPWNQRHILAGKKSNGWWAVDVAKAGTYDISLRRWPTELDEPITASVPGGQAISADSARVKVGDVDESKPIPDGALEVTFRVNLKAGQTRLQTWFMDDQGESRGAYYAYVTRVS